MTRQHFQFIADAIAELDPQSRARIAEHFAERLPRTNYQFRASLFLNACKADASASREG